MKLLEDPDEEEDEEEVTPENNGEDEIKDRETRTQSVRQIPCELRNLQTFYNPAPGEFTKAAMEAALLGATDSGYAEPKTFREAWDHEDPETREKWREAIRHEFRMMIKRKVWRYQPKDTINPSRRLVGHKRVFKVEHSGIH